MAAETTSTTGLSADPARARRRCGAGGFTLLELVLVMVIICTVLAMAAPSLRGFFASRQTEDAAAYIVALSGLARSQAIAEGRVYRLNFDVDAGKYWLTAQYGGAFERLGSEFGRAFLVPEGAKLSLRMPQGPGGATWVGFYPNGRVDVAAIRLTGRRGDVVEVVCPSPTERYRVAPAGEEASSW